MANEINPINDHDFEFHNLLYSLFIVQKKYPIGPVAEKMGISSDTLYCYAEGKSPFPISRFISLFRATGGDRQLLDYFVDRCGYAIVPTISQRQLVDLAKAIGNSLLAMAGAREGKT